MFVEQGDRFRLNEQLPLLTTIWVGRRNAGKSIAIKLDKLLFVGTHSSHTHIIGIEGNALFPGPKIWYLTSYMIHPLFHFRKSPKISTFFVSIKSHTYFNYAKERNRKTSSKKSTAAQTLCRIHRRKRAYPFPESLLRVTLISFGLIFFVDFWVLFYADRNDVLLSSA